MKENIIAIIDYGCGNVGSVQNMFSKIGIWSFIAKRPDELKKANRIVLPGVGAFDNGVKKLKETGFWEPIKFEVEECGVKILGICLGMQLFFESSEEGLENGYGWFSGKLKYGY